MAVMSRAISRTSLLKGSKGINNLVDFWYWRISNKAFCPGRYLVFCRGVEACRGFLGGGFAAPPVGLVGFEGPATGDFLREGPATGDFLLAGPGMGVFVIRGGDLPLDGPGSGEDELTLGLLGGSGDLFNLPDLLDGPAEGDLPRDGGSGCLLPWLAGPLKGFPRLALLADVFFPSFSSAAATGVRTAPETSGVVSDDKLDLSPSGFFFLLESCFEFSADMVLLCE